MTGLATPPSAETVTFPSGALTLHGILYRPEGKGPFPALLYNHGSAPGMLNSQAAELLGPIYASHGWVFFMPYRRGQGLSASAGPYIMDEVNKAKKQGGMSTAASTMTRLLKTDHLNDQLAALDWLKKASFVQAGRIAVAGNSFGGIETILGVEHGSYCAGVDASGAAQSWANAPEIRTAMLEAAQNAKCPVYFFQAENDYDLSPSRELSKATKAAGKVAEVKFYPPYGSSTKEGHSFAYLGNKVWADDVFAFLKRHCGK